MIASNAFVSIDQLVCSKLLQKNYSIHYYVRYLKLAGDAIRELQLSHLPLVHHTILTRNEGESWFNLPEGFTDWVQVGVRIGEQWRPIGVSNRLMPYPNSDGNAEYGTEFSGAFNKGDWTNWLRPVYHTNYGDFDGEDFFNEDYLVDDETTSAEGCCPGDYPYRKDVVTFNPQKGVIMCPLHFPCDTLYLTYIGIGGIDTMTHIPVQAQSTIEAYMDWKYAANNRSIGKGEVRDYERLYYAELRQMKARVDPLTMTDIAQIINRYYGQQQYFSTYGECRQERRCCGQSSCSCSSGASCPNEFDIILTTANLVINSTDPSNIIYTVFEPRWKFKTVSRISTEAQTYNSAFWNKPQDSDTLTTTTLNFYYGQILTVTLQS